MTTITVKVADNEKSKLTKFIADIGGEILSESSISDKVGELAKYQGALNGNRAKKLESHTIQMRDEWTRNI